MEARSIHAYVRVGANIRYLRSVAANFELGGERRVVDSLSRITADLEASGLHVTKRATEQHLRQMLEGWLAEKKECSKEAWDKRVLTADEARSLREAADYLESTLLAEASGIFAHVTREKMFPTEKLLTAVDALFHPDVFAQLPTVAQYDFGEAGRCLAFELPTAAAFHSMRGTEDVLKWFYLKFVHDGKKLPMWANMVSALAALTSPPPTVILNSLDHLRVGFRNPTQHPDKIYDIYEAQDLFSLSLDAVNRMVKHVDTMRSETSVP